MVMVALLGCGQVDWSQLVATATPVGTGASLATPTVESSFPEGPSTILNGMSCEVTEEPFLIVCAASVCNVRDEIEPGMVTVIVYNVPRETLLSAFGVCECVDCVPFSQWYWLGDDRLRGALWAVADEHIWQRVED